MKIQQQIKTPLSFDQKIVALQALRPFLDSSVQFDVQDTANKKAKLIIENIDNNEMAVSITTWRPSVSVKDIKKVTKKVARKRSK